MRVCAASIDIANSTLKMWNTIGNVCIYLENAKPLYTIAITCTYIFYYSISNRFACAVPLPMELISKHINRTYHGLFIRNLVWKCYTKRWHNTDKPFSFWQFTFDKMQITFGSSTKNIEVEKYPKHHEQKQAGNQTNENCYRTHRNFSICFRAQVDGNFLLSVSACPMF